MTPEAWRKLCIFEGVDNFKDTVSRGELTARKIAANNKNAIRLSHVLDAEAYYMAGGYYKEWMAKEAMK